MNFSLKFLLLLISLISCIGSHLNAHVLELANSTSPTSFTTDCNLPTNVELVYAFATALIIDWTEEGDAPSWEVEIVAQGDAPTGTGIVTSEKPYTFTDLASFTTYDIYIRSICDDIGSPWTDPVSYETASSYCNGRHFYDSGGENATYEDNENTSTTIFPDNPGEYVTAFFNYFNLEATYDFLRVYDGPDSSYPLLAELDGFINVPPINSTHLETGALTFVFTSDVSVVREGWDISFECQPFPDCPTSITDVNLLESSLSSLTIEWIDTADVVYWEVGLFSEGAFAPTDLITSDNAYIFENLQSGTIYDFYIRSLCAEGTSYWLGPYRFTTSSDYCNGDRFYDSGGANGNYQNNENTTTTISPSTPGDRVVAAIDAFNTESNFDFLRIYDGPDATYPLITTLTGTTTIDTIKASDDVSGALTFVFTSDTNTTRSGWDFNIICEPMPPCPLNLDNIVLADAGSSSLVIGWTDSAEISSWEIELRPTGGLPSNSIITSNNPYTFESLDVDTEYDFYIRSICDAGNSDWSGPFTFLTLTNYCGGSHFYDSGLENGPYLDGETITTTIFPENDGDFVTAIFNSFDTEDNYDYLKVYDGPDDSFPLIAELNGNINVDPIPSTHVESGALTFVFTSDGTITRDGWDISFICQAFPPCPETVSDIELVYSSTSSISIDWTDIDGVSAWEVSLSLDDTAPNNGIITSNNPYTFEELTMNSTYYFYIRSLCNEEESSVWVGPFVFQTTADHCNGDHFYDSGGENGDYQSGELITTTIFPSVVGGIVNITFQSFDVEQFFDRLSIYDGPNDSHPLIIAASGQDNPGSISSTHESGALTFVFDSDGSNVGTGWDAIIDCNFTTNTKNVFSHVGVLDYFPNPVSDLLTIDSKVVINQIHIFDFTGKLIDIQTQFNARKFEVNLSNYPSGIYYFKAVSDTDKWYEFKVVKLN